MAKYTTTITADTTGQYVCDIVKPRYADAWHGQIGVSGDFGNGTLTVGTSDDNGVTIIPDENFSATAAKKSSFVDMASPRNLNESVKIYAIMTGATNPDVVVTVVDNR